MKTNPGIEALACRVKELREKKGMSQREVCRQLEVSTSTISDLESGQHVPNCMLVWRIARLFRVSTDYLIAGREPAWKEDDEQIV